MNTSSFSPASNFHICTRCYSVNLSRIPVSFFTFCSNLHLTNSAVILVLASSKSVHLGDAGRQVSCSVKFRRERNSFASSPGNVEANRWYPHDQSTSPGCADPNWNTHFHVRQLTSLLWRNIFTTVSKIDLHQLQCCLLEFGVGLNFLNALSSILHPSLASIWIRS